MNKNKIKLISYILAYITFLSGTYLKYQNIIKSDKIFKNRNDFTTSQTTESIKETETIIENIKNIEENIKELTEKEELIYTTTDTPMYSSNTNKSLKICNFKPYETALKILSYGNKWTLIKYNNQFGYISNDYLKTASSHLEKTYQHHQHKDIVLTTIDYIDIKISPSIQAETLKILRINTELEVLAKVDNGWLLVKNNETIGYIQENYTLSLLEKLKNQYRDLNITQLNIERIIYSKIDDLNIYYENNKENEILNQLDKYESVRVLGEYTNNYLIMTNDYNFGFINKNDTELLQDEFVIVDISEQRIYMYKDNILYCVAPVTTGKDATPSDVGLFKIWYKGEDEEIVPGCRVNYWMIYNNNYEGLHDAENWRKEYGMHTEEEKQEQNYKWNGSNGCPNLELITAKLIYENSKIGTKVLVHK